MIVVNLELIENLSAELHKINRQYLNNEIEVEKLCNSLGQLIEANLYFDPNWWLDLKFHRFDETEIQLLTNQSLQIDGLLFWTHRHFNDYYHHAIIKAVLSLPAEQLDQTASQDQFDYRITCCYEDIHRYITPQGLYYESRNGNRLPKPNVEYFIELLIEQRYRYANAIEILELLGESGHRILREKLAQEPALLERIIDIISGYVGDRFHYLDYYYLIEAGLNSSDEQLKENYRHIVLEWATYEPAYQKYLPEQPQKEFDIEDYWSYLAGSPPPGFTPENRLSKIRELVTKDAQAMARLIDCLDHKNSAALSLLGQVNYNAAGAAVEKLKYLLDTAPPEYYLPADRWWAAKIFSILDRLKTPQAQAIIDQALNGPEAIKDCALIGIGWNSGGESAVTDDKTYYLEKFRSLLKDPQSNLSDFSGFYKLEYFKDYPEVAEVIRGYAKFLIDKLVDNSDDDRKSTILLELRSLGEYAQDAIPHMLEIFWQIPEPRFTQEDLRNMEDSRQDPTDPAIVPPMQDMAISTLRAIAVPTPAVIEAFKAVLTMYNINVCCPQCNEYDLCKDAVEGLIRIGKLKIVLEAIKTVDDAGFVEAYFLACSHTRIDIVDELLAEMSDPLIYYYGLQILRAFGNRAAAALPKLIEWLNDKNSAYRPLVASAIGAIGAAASPAIATLAAMLKDSDLSVSIRSAAALGSIGKASLPAIINALNPARPFNQSPAISSTEALPDEDQLPEVTVCFLIKALSEIAATDANAVEIQVILKEWQDHPDVRINFLAQQGLTKSRV